MRRYNEAALRRDGVSCVSDLNYLNTDDWKELGVSNRYQAGASTRPLPGSTSAPFEVHTGWLEWCSDQKHVRLS